MSRPGKSVYGMTVSRVRIPLSPPTKSKPTFRWVLLFIEVAKLVWATPINNKTSERSERLWFGWSHPLKGWFRVKCGHSGAEPILSHCNSFIQYISFNLTIHWTFIQFIIKIHTTWFGWSPPYRDGSGLSAGIAGLNQSALISYHQNITILSTLQSSLINYH